MSRATVLWVLAAGWLLIAAGIGCDVAGVTQTAGLSLKDAGVALMATTVIVVFRRQR